MKRQWLYFAGIILILAMTSIAYAVPYPYREYEMQEPANLKEASIIYSSLCGEYMVYQQKETESSYPWSNIGYAMLLSPEVLDAAINRLAEYELWTPKEKETRRQEYFSLFIDDTISFMVGLMEDVDVDEGDYRNLNSANIIRLVLETDQAKRYTALKTENISDTDVLIDKFSFSSGDNRVYFQRYDDNGVQIIDEDTQWIRLWVVSRENRIFFEFAFANK